MRDVVLTLIIFGSIPFILKRPYIGILMWIWVSIMNPHRLTWGFAYDFPFAFIIAIVTLTSIVLTRERQKFPLTPITVALIGFIVWMNVTTLFALLPSQEMWLRVMKIMLMVLATLVVMYTRRHIELVVWVLALSIGFYGVKGGIFTLLTGGAYRVWGPAGSFIEGNNEVALALILVIPLMRYLYTLVTKKWQKWAFGGTMALCALASLGSYSRGALLAFAAMSFFLWLKSRHKAAFGVVMAAAGVVLLMFMPSEWMERMNSISSYEQDGSAMGRINAWWMTYNLAKDRPLVGGGFEIYEPHIFRIWAPNPEDVHAAHSIYFQVLGEHGFVGLLLYLCVGIATWRAAKWVVRNAKGVDELKWAEELAKMVQVSMVGFAVGGAFLSLAYFDLPYYLMTTVILLKLFVQRTLAERAAAAAPARLRRFAPRGRIVETAPSVSHKR